jgi:hypothetical protein
MNALRRIAVIVVCVGAAAYAIPAAYTAADSMKTWVKPTVAEPWSGGRVWGEDVDFLDWARQEIPPGDKFMIVDGTGNVASNQWGSFELYPGVFTTDPAEADWVVLYGIYRGNVDPAFNKEFPDEHVYSDGFSILGRKGVPTATDGAP